MSQRITARQLKVGDTLASRENEPHTVTWIGKLADCDPVQRALVDNGCKPIAFRLAGISNPFVMDAGATLMRAE